MPNTCFYIQVRRNEYISYKMTRTLVFPRFHMFSLNKYMKTQHFQWNSSCLKNKSRKFISVQQQSQQNMFFSHFNSPGGPVSGGSFAHFLVFSETFGFRRFVEMCKRYNWVFEKSPWGASKIFFFKLVLFFCVFGNLQTAQWVLQSGLFDFVKNRQTIR